MAGEEEDVLEFGHGPNANGVQWNDIRDFWYRSGYAIEYNPTNGISEPNVIPEPSTFLLLSAGLLGFALRRKKVVKKGNILSDKYLRNCMIFNCG